jgi:hypothetical protein
MASPDEPNNESVPIDLPLPTAEKSPDPNIKPRETVRIQLPLREPLGKAPVHSPTGPPNPPSFSPPLSASVMPVPDSPASGPKKETARIPLVPDPLPSAGQMKNPQSVIMPNVTPRNPLSAIAPAEKKPMLIWWILLGVSALILIIQIWTYFS